MLCCAVALWGDGSGYDALVGRWSRLVAPELVAWLDADAGGRWLDAGCGTGALSAAVLAHADPAVVLAADPSAAMLARARQQADPRRVLLRADAQALPVRDGGLDVVASGLVLNFLPRPADAVAGMRRAVRGGGTVAAYVWDYAGGMQLLRAFWDAAGAVHPDGVRVDEAVRNPLCAPDPLAALWREAGLRDVEVTALDVRDVLPDADALWTPFLVPGAPAPDHLAALPPERQEALRRKLLARVPVADDGSIALGARAWAVRGRV